MNQTPSPNQQKCYINWEPFTIKYSKDIPKDPLEAATEVINVVEALRPIFEPTSADLILGCAEKESRQKDTNIDPSKIRWRIRSSDLPEEIKLRRECDYEEDNSSPDFEVATLSKPVLIDWIEKALDQKCPDPEVYDLAWFSFEFNTVKTRIFTEELLVEQSMMRATHTRYGYYEYPLVREQNQLWVYSPVMNLYLFPTFAISVDHDDWLETMELTISVGWSWWTQEGFKERDVLLNTLPQIEALGWELEFFSDLDKYYVPREA